MQRISAARYAVQKNCAATPGDPMCPPPYGYKKDPKDKHQLIVDPEAAETVKRIYEMCLQGTAKLQIVMYLNDHGIPSPTAYRKLKGLPYSPAISDAPMWGNKIITDILRNPIYTGDLVQGRRRVKSYKVHSTRHGNRAGIQALRLCARVWRGQTLRD
ncbi:recombinase family protein [Acutalibacter sp. 1XD8-33]|uniref:recombinase family protein n=1 Tax=Acutalibacter sp. 1XD8-33 TaxID=2320081 RepID=UPI00242A4D51|nr:recombinase family protein [Acutalibacter sp. 1XD8-33]